MEMNPHSQIGAKLWEHALLIPLDIECYSLTNFFQASPSKLKSWYKGVAGDGCSKIVRTELKAFFIPLQNIQGRIAFDMGYNLFIYILPFKILSNIFMPENWGL